MGNCLKTLRAFGIPTENKSVALIGLIQFLSL